MASYKNGLQSVEDLAVYIQKNVDVRVFKFKKDTSLKNEPYICLNNLSFSYGNWVNRYGIINVNVHYPNNTDGSPRTEEINRLVEDIYNLIPTKNSETEDDENILLIKGCFYEIESDSNCMEDTDDTHFVNIRVCVTF